MLKKIVQFISVFILVLVINLNASENNRPKNIIIMIGDGMGLNQVYSSVLSDNTSVFKNFNSIGLSITKSADDLITDSAAGATALSTGSRTKNGFIGVDTNKVILKNIMEYAEEKGLSTGVVVTSSITHATPAGFIAHAESRKLEFEIAEDFSNSKIDVAIGGGMKFFSRNPKGNLIERLKQKNYEILENYEKLNSYSGDENFYALLEEEALKSAGKRNYALGELTSKAIQHLSKNEKGFVLLVEGSQIDWACHDNDQKQIEAEVKDFATAISEALKFAKEDKNTLVVVTADHETSGLSIVDGEKDGSKVKFDFAATSHTANAVGIFSYGPGEEKFRGFFENYEIGRKLIHFLNPIFSAK